MRERLILCYHFDAVVAGGGLQYSTDMARHWLKKGIRVHVVTSSHPRDLSDMEQYARSGQLVIHEVCDYSRLLLSHQYDQTVYDKTARILESVKPELIHVHNFHGLIGAIWAAVDSGRKTVYCVLDFGLLCMNWCLYDGSPTPCSGPAPDKCRSCMLQNYRPPWLKRTLAHLPLFLLKYMVKNPAYFKQHALMQRYYDRAGEHLKKMVPLLARFDRVVTISPITGDVLEKFGVAREKIIFRVQGAPFVDKPAVDGDAEPVTTLMFLGHMGPMKGFQVICDALNKIQSGLPLKIKLFGPEAQRFAFRCGERVKSYLAAAPSLVGRQVEEALIRSDGLIVPSQWYENSPYAVLRSLAVGRPVLTADQPGISHLIADGRNGFLIRPNNADSWADMLTRVAGDPALLRGMRAQCDYTKTVEAYCGEIEEATIGAVK